MEVITENTISNNIVPPVQPSGQSVQPSVEPNQTVTSQPVVQSSETAGQSAQEDVTIPATNLNREGAMEEALSRTTQYTPFEVPKEQLQNQQSEDPKSGLILVIIIVIIAGLFILFLPTISSLFGWN